MKISLALMSDPDFLRSLFTADLALIVEADSTISWCNDLASDLLGTEPGFVAGPDSSAELGLYFPDAVTPLQFEDFPLSGIFRGESIRGVEICVRGSRTLGDDVWFAVTAQPLYSADLDQIDGSVILAHDITSRRRALEGLMDANAALQALVQASPLPILALATDGSVTFWNRAAEHVFGWTESEAMGRPVPFVSDEEREDHPGMRNEELSGQVLINREVRRHRRDGAVVDVSVSTAPIRDRKGNQSGTICVYIDISERKRLEEQLWQAAKLESLGILAGGVAHDFNNLLTSILGNASLALDDADRGSQQAKALGNVVDAVQRAAVLTNQMLAYSGRGKFHLEQIDLSQMIAGMVKLLESALGAGIGFSLDLPFGLPGVYADSGQLQQIVMNLVINAGEAIRGAGQVQVRTGVVDIEPEGAMEGGPHAFIEVEDTGHGMDAGTLQCIFDPFFTTKFTGRGLGLAAVLGIVRGHNGVIQVKSAPGEGSRFVVYLPVASAHAASASA